MRIADVLIEVSRRGTEGEDRLEYRWLVLGDPGRPVADHRLALPARDGTRDGTGFAGALARGVPPLEAAVGLPVRWTSETWPLVLRPGTLVARRLGLEARSAGLLLVERGIGINGSVVVEHDLTVLAGRWSQPALLRSMSLAGDDAGAGARPVPRASGEPAPHASASPAAGRERRPARMRAARRTGRLLAPSPADRR